MEFWIKNTQCTGCGACINICPVGAIKAVTDNCGFKHPIIDIEKCINCGQCKQTCPILKKLETNKSTKPNVFACWSKDKNVRYKSTTGGMFTEFAKNIIIKGGYVAGAAYGDNNMVIHKIVSDFKGIEELRQSKYIQSDTLMIYQEVKKLLINGKLVAFAGAPCQVAGLYKFLKNDYDNLFTIEFICRGMNSPKAYRAWLDEIQKTEEKKVNRVWFKYKEDGWKKSPKCTRIDFEDNSYKIYKGDDNKFMYGYLNSNLYIRPSCAQCHFNGLPRQADITLADFWGITGELDDDKGTSLVLLNSSKGNEYFSEIKENIHFYERNLEEIYKGNICFTQSVKINKNSEKFLENLNNNNFSKLLKKYGKEPFHKRSVKKVKKIIKKLLRR